MTTSMELYQGDSSDVISIATYLSDVLVTELDDYQGRFAIVKKLGGTPLLEKSMAVVDERFQVQISPLESEELSVGNYIGICEISNDTIPFRKETHVTIRVLKQGYED